MKLTTLIPASLVTAALVMAGCATTGYNRAHSASTSLEKTAQDIRKGNGQIDAVLFSLASLINDPAPDLQPQFRKFDDAVNTLESLANDVNERTLTLQNQGAKYLQTWDAELAKIQNEDIRIRSAERKATVSVNLEKVRVSYVRTNADFAPFISDLKDIRTALAMDLTRSGLTAVQDSAQKAKASALPLRISLSNLELDFKSLGLALSSIEK